MRGGLFILLASVLGLACRSEARRTISEVVGPEPLTDIQQLAAGHGWTCALQGSGNVYCWGDAKPEHCDRGYCWGAPAPRRGPRPSTRRRGAQCWAMWSKRPSNCPGNRRYALRVGREEHRSEPAGLRRVADREAARDSHHGRAARGDALRICSVVAGEWPTCNEMHFGVDGAPTPLAPPYSWHGQGPPNAESWTP